MEHTRLPAINAGLCVTVRRSGPLDGDDGAAWHAGSPRIATAAIAAAARLMEVPLREHFTAALPPPTRGPAWPAAATATFRPHPGFPIK
jgi:hypothetical protein